jgi:hypothetical protein
MLKSNFLSIIGKGCGAINSHRLMLLPTAICILAMCTVCMSEEFYVDGNKGSDYASGRLDKPFRTLQKALQVVSIRVNQGIRSDKIFLRGGVYRHDSTETLYQLNLKGTADDYALLSAMPCEPDAPGGVKRKSGQWYEKVVFDDGWKIETPWTRVPGRPDIWKTNPGFVHNEWPASKMRWSWTGRQPPKKSGGVHFFTLAPYMILQDGRPLHWVHTVDEMRKPGVRSYDFESKTLYVWPLEKKNAPACTFESWYGGPDKNGYLLRDGEGRALFDGNLEYAAIRGFEFRMLTRIFEFHRRGYVSEQDRVRQHYVRFEDNSCNYCFIHMLLDANTVLSDQRNDGLIPPDYEDRSNWTVRNNVFFRPTKECFQVHGDDHVFEYNEIIDHGGPWAGPAARVSAVNARNMRNVAIRYNYIQGQGSGPYLEGSVFMIEAEGGHADRNGDYIFGGVTYEYNMFANLTRGTAIFAGKGGCRMRNITIRNNIFKTHPGGPAIRLASPHFNLRIENNVFYDQANPIELDNTHRKMKYESLPSSISIRNNIFMNNRRTIAPALLAAHLESDVVIDRNLFFRNQQDGLGQRAMEADPLFRDPEALDFCLKTASPAVVDGKDLGPYDGDSDPPAGTQWWEISAGQVPR